MEPRSLAPLSLLVLLLVGARQARADEVRLQNGSLERWADGAPEAWEVSVGARSGAGPRSRLAPLEGGGLLLEGDAGVRIWQYVSQRFAPEADTTYRLDFSARVQGRRLEPGQFGSCYVGFMFRDEGGARRGLEFREVRASDWQAETLFASTPAGATQAEVAIFLSLTGSLSVRDVRLRTVAPQESFQVLVKDMDRGYSFFALRGTDWPALASSARAEAEKAKTPGAFADAILPMLASLKDPHVWIEMPDGRLIPSMPAQVEPNVDYAATIPSLDRVTQVVRNVISARTKRGGFGFLAVGTLQQSDEEFRRTEAALRALFDAPGLILDLRVNTGGAEVRAQQLASHLAGERTLYARSRLRAGPQHDAFYEGAPRHVVPHPTIRYKGPIVCLIGPVCMSSGEGFALMLKALPDAVLLGQPTRGASGNPLPLRLPNGVRVHYSRWVSLLPDGTPFEGRGVQPDVFVEHAAAGDRTLEAAIAELERR